MVVVNYSNKLIILLYHNEKLLINLL